MSYAAIPSERTLNSPNPLRDKASFSNSKSFKAAKVDSSRRRKGTAAPETAANDSSPSFPIIVHSHLGWDWVWQRPQQFVARLSRQHKVIFVETLAPDAGLAAPLARFRAVDDFPNITVLTVQFPSWRWSDGKYVDAECRRLVQQFVASLPGRQFQNPVQWFYDPMAVTAFAGHMDEILTVYDCMDELSK